MLSGFELSPDLLERQGRSLRRLARSLLGDAHAAEDVVQDTWLACLRQPGAIPERFSAWVTIVARNLARRHVRGEGRRREREERVAAGRREGVELGTLEHEEALRAVTAALLALEEPFKSALIQRYFEERTPAEIAAHGGIPLSTVKSRLARGLALLRTRLAAEHGSDGRARALLVLAGGRALVAGGVAVGGPALAAALSIMALVGGGGLLWWLGRASEPARAEVTAAALVAGVDGGEESTPVPAPAAQEPAAGSQREAVGGTGGAAPEDARSAAPLPAEPSTSFRIAGRVRDEDDLPVAGARILLAPRGLPLDRAAETDAEGRFAVEVLGRLPTLDIAFAVESNGVRSGQRELRLAAGNELSVDLAIEGHSTEADLELVVEGKEGRVLVESLDVATKLELELAAYTAPPHLGRPEPDSTLRPGPDGKNWFTAPLDTGSCSRPDALAVSVIEKELVTRLDLQRLAVSRERMQIEERVALGVRMYERVEEDHRPLGTVEGNVRGADGTPVANALVGWGEPGRRFSASVRTDAQGAFRLTEVPAGEVWLRAGGGDDGVATGHITLADGERRFWDPNLDRGAEVLGRVVGADGAGLDGCRIELWSAGSALLWSDVTRADSAGRFAFPNVIAGPLELHVFTKDGVFPVRILPAALGEDVGTVVLGPRDLALGSLVLRTLEADGRPRSGGELRVWQLSSGRGRFVRAAGEKGERRLEGLAPGLYRLELASALGPQDLGLLQVPEEAGDEPLDLGETRPAADGRLVLDVRGGDAAVRGDVRLSLWSARAEAFVHALDEEGALPHLLLLPPGEFVLCAVRPDGTRAETVLTIRSGEATRITLDLDGSALAFLEDGLDPAWTLANDEQRAQLETERCATCHERGQ